MKPRNFTVDLARGFVVFIMPATHVTLYYSTQSVQEGIWGTLLKCIAEGAGAQVFMFLLGFSFYLGREKTLSIIIKRGISIFLLAYLLNFFKFVLPGFLGIIPNSFYTYYGLEKGLFALIDMLMVGDIFQFAGISYIICGLIYKCKSNWLLPVGISLLITLISPFIWGIRLPNFLLDYTLKLLNGYPPAVFFPFFPWIVYPLLGLGLGKFYLSCNNEQKFYQYFLKAGIVCIVIGIIIMQFEPNSFNYTFYRLGPGGSIFHIGLVLLWLRLCYWASIRLCGSRTIIALFQWCSSNITTIYVFQWLIISWMLPHYGFMTRSLPDTLLAVMTVTLLTHALAAITYLFLRKKRGHFNKGDHNISLQVPKNLNNNT